MRERLLNLAHGAAQALRRSRARGSILDEYVQTAPHPQRALDIFKDEWTSTLPAPLEDLAAGDQPLFGDPRILWAHGPLGGFKGKTVLELGPLEGGHSWMMVNLGAELVTAVEANTRAFLKCLILKELLDLRRVRFLCGDFVSYLKEEKPTFDLVVASGVLYHMRNPVELIELLSRTANQVFLWTHYYSAAACGVPRRSHRFSLAREAEHGGFRHTLYRQEYRRALDGKGYCGGGAEHSNWLTRDDIVGALRHFGFARIDIGHETSTHPSGPEFAVVAQRV